MFGVWVGTEVRRRRCIPCLRSVTCLEMVNDQRSDDGVFERQRALPQVRGLTGEMIDANLECAIAS
jgi:hypothetical protein